MIDPQALRETMFRLRYGFEQLTEAFRQWNNAVQQAKDAELERLRTARARHVADLLLVEAEYQEWKQKLEERSQ